MSHALDASIVTETLVLWLGSLEGAPQPPPSSSLVETMAYVALYNVVLRRCAKLVLKLRTHSLALARQGSETDNKLAEGWSLEALVTTCGADPATPKTSWSHYIQKIVADSQDAAGPNTLGAVLLTYYKLRSVLGQMQTKGRRLGLTSVAGFGVKEDPLVAALGENAKRLYTKTKAALGITMDDVASESDGEGDKQSAHREKREVSLLLRQAHASSLKDANKAPAFGSSSLFSPEREALFTKGDDKAIEKSLGVAAAVHKLKSTGLTPPSAGGKSLFSAEKLALFTKGNDKHIAKSLETARKIHHHQATTKGGSRAAASTPPTPTGGHLTSVITRAADLLTPASPANDKTSSLGDKLTPKVGDLVATATALPSAVGQALGESAVHLSSKSKAPSKPVDDLVATATALPSAVGQALGESAVHLSTKALNKKPKQAKKHVLTKTLQKSKGRRRKHKVKPSKRRANRSASWGVL